LAREWTQFSCASAGEHRETTTGRICLSVASTLFTTTEVKSKVDQGTIKPGRRYMRRKTECVLFEDATKLKGGRWALAIPQAKLAFSISSL